MSTFTEDAEIARRSTITIAEPVEMVTASEAGTGIAPAVRQGPSDEGGRTQAPVGSEGLVAANVHDYERTHPRARHQQCRGRAALRSVRSRGLSTMISDCQRG